jgi:adenine-specific DNA-methyltransferase
LCPVKMGNARKYGLDYIKKLPISEGDSEIQNQMQILVDKVISTKKELADTTEIETQIDQLVYKLYDLTEEEIKIIENS